MSLCSIRANQSKLSLSLIKGPTSLSLAGSLHPYLARPPPFLPHPPPPTSKPLDPPSTRHLLPLQQKEREKSLFFPCSTSLCLASSVLRHQVSSLILSFLSHLPPPLPPSYPLFLTHLLLSPLLFHPSRLSPRSLRNEPFPHPPRCVYASLLGSQSRPLHHPTHPPDRKTRINPGEGGYEWRKSPTVSLLSIWEKIRGGREEEWSREGEGRGGCLGGGSRSMGRAIGLEGGSNLKRVETEDVEIGGEGGKSSSRGEKEEASSILERWRNPREGGVDDLTVLSLPSLLPFLWQHTLVYALPCSRPEHGSRSLRCLSSNERKSSFNSISLSPPQTGETPKESKLTHSPSPSFLRHSLLFPFPPCCLTPCGSRTSSLPSPSRRFSHITNPLSCSRRRGRKSHELVFADSALSLSSQSPPFGRDSLLDGCY